MSTNHSSATLKELERDVLDAQRERLAMVDTFVDPSTSQPIHPVQLALLDLPPGSGSSTQELIGRLLSTGYSASEVRARISQFPVNRVEVSVVQQARRRLGIVMPGKATSSHHLAVAFWCPIDELVEHSEVNAIRPGTSNDVRSLASRLDMPVDGHGWLVLTSATGWEPALPETIDGRWHCVYFEPATIGGWRLATQSNQNLEASTSEWILRATLPESDWTLLQRAEDWFQREGKRQAPLRIIDVHNRTGLPPWIAEQMFRQIGESSPGVWHFEEDQGRLMSLV